MKGIIVDDEPLARKGIHILAEKMDSLTIVDEFSNAIEATAYINGRDDIDIIFLDIEMPGLNGIEFLRAVPMNNHVILTTAYPQYALEAFELDVVDYLLKPVKFERFFRAVNKVHDLKKMQKSVFGIDKTGEDFFYIKSDRKFIKLHYQDICFIKGMKDYVMISTKDDRYMTAMNVGTIFKQLPDELFARVSKSYIINVDKITQISTDFIYLGEEDIPLGNSYKENFLKNHVKDRLLGR